MFSQKINSLQDQISELQAKQQQYRSLEQEANAVVASIARLHQAAAELEEQAEIKKMVAQAIGYSVANPTEEPAPEPEPKIYEEIVEPAAETSNEKYSTPEELKAVLAVEDTETILMQIANILDAAPAIEIQGRVWYFVQNLPVELCDRAIPYLPKSIIPEWRKQMDMLAEEAKASIFPTEQPTPTYEPAIDDIVECLSSGQVGRITYLCDSPQGRMATVLVPGGASNFHISNLKYIGKFEGEKPEDAQKQTSTEPATSNDDEIDQLAKQCLGLRSWSQIRIFADSNPAVITRMQEIASAKAEKRIINNLPSLILGYIERANDRSDLEWLPTEILNEVETLLTQPPQQSIA